MNEDGGHGMLARIYKPAKTAMQSGRANTKHWVLEFEPEHARQLDPLMGWTSSMDTETQVRIRFSTREAAEEFANRHNIRYIVQEPHQRKPKIKSYADNFRWNAPE